MTPEKRRSLNASLARLGRCEAGLFFVPEVFIENELAIAVRRFGVFKVLRTVLRQWWETPWPL